MGGKCQAHLWVVSTGEVVLVRAAGAAGVVVLCSRARGVSVALLAGLPIPTGGFAAIDCPMSREAAMKDSSREGYLWSTRNPLASNSLFRGLTAVALCERGRQCGSLRVVWLHGTAGYRSKQPSRSDARLSRQTLPGGWEVQWTRSVVVVEIVRGVESVEAVAGSP